MRKVLLTTGDSFTDNTHRSSAHPLLDCSWPKWPELLADKLDMDCINLGRSGAGNKYIHSAVRDFIEKKPRKYNGKNFPKINKNDIGLVVAGWSQCFRTDYQLGKWGRWAHERMPFNKQGDLFGWVHESLNHYLDFQILCEKYNLPYIHTQMIPMYLDFLEGLPPTEQQIVYEGMDRIKDTITYDGDKTEAYKEIAKILLRYDYNIKNFMYWEKAALSAGGSSMNIKLFGYWPNDYVISEFDNHPNAKGNELIAQTLFEYYEKEINS